MGCSSVVSCSSVVVNDQSTKKSTRTNELTDESKEVYEDNPLRTERKDPILIGINDLDGTSYINATIECFSNINELTEYFLNPRSFNPNDSTKKITNVYYEVLKNLWNEKNNNGSFSLSNFKKVLCAEDPFFARNSSNDPRFLITFLIDRLNTELNGSNSGKNIQNIKNESDPLDEVKTFKTFLQDYQSKNNPIIACFFYGIHEMKSKCCTCQTMEFNFQIYSFLEFSLENINKYFFDIGKRQPLKNQYGSNPDIDIYECFDYYNRIELMNGDNQKLCNKCGGLRDACYQTLVYSTPYILILYLNRGKGGLYMCKVNFYEKLNISKYVIYNEESNDFELFAVIAQYGYDSLGAHFVAFCKNRIDHDWYLYNDDSVTKCGDREKYSGVIPFFLFYKRK